MPSVFPNPKQLDFVDPPIGPAMKTDLLYEVLRFERFYLRSSLRLPQL